MSIVWMITGCLLETGGGLLFGITGGFSECLEFWLCG